MDDKDNERRVLIAAIREELAKVLLSERLSEIEKEDLIRRAAEILWGR